MAALADGSERRLHLVERALREGHGVEEVAAASRIDPWFVDQIDEVVEGADALKGRFLSAVSARDLREAKRIGLSDGRDRHADGRDRGRGAASSRHPRVCVPCSRPWTRARASSPRAPLTTTPPTKRRRGRARERPRVVILGAGPNRIGQGIEFDYACVHAAFALEEAGFESVMVNSNPETVSTDYDTSSRLYFEPLSAEDVLAVCRAERPVGVIAQLGGQTPLRLARTLAEEGFTVLGTSPDAIDLAEDRGKFARHPGRARTSPRPLTVRRARWTKPARSRTGSATRWWCGPRTCWGAARWRSSTTTTSSRRSCAPPRTPRPTIRSWSTDSSKGRSRWTSTRSPTRTATSSSGRSWNTSRRPACTRAIPHARSHPATLSDDELDVVEDIARRLARRLGVVGLAEPAAGRQGRAHLGPGGEPSRLAHRAVRLQGDRGLIGPHRDPGAGRDAPSPSWRPSVSCPRIPTTTGTCRTRASRPPCCRSAGSPGSTRCSGPR